MDRFRNLLNQQSESSLNAKAFREKFEKLRKRADSMEKKKMPNVEYFSNI